MVDNYHIEPGRLWRTVKKKKLRQGDIYLYLMLIPVVAIYLIFHYIPMYGIIISFKDFNIFKGITASEWVGFNHFIRMFHSQDFWLAFRNTFTLNLLTLAFGFPAPILLALMLNEISKVYIKRIIQSIVYLPHFLSWVVIAGLMLIMLSEERGIINVAIKAVSGTTIPFLTNKGWWIGTYIISGIWKEIGWGTIIYLAAITSIDPNLFEAATVDGAGRLRQIRHITLPCLLPTIVILLIMQIGRMASIGFEKPFMLRNSLVIRVAQVISTFVYDKGIVKMEYSYTTAVGLSRSVVNLTLILIANYLSRRLTEESLW